MKPLLRFRPLCSQRTNATFCKLAAITLTLVGLAGCATAPSGAAARGIPSGWVVLREQHSGKLVSVPPARNVLQWSRRDGPEQLWRTEPHADGTVTMVSAASGLVLEGATDPDPGGEVFVTKPTGAPNQRWTMESTQDDLLRLRVQHSGRYLTTTPGQRDDGADVAIWSDVGAHWQQWRIEPAGEGWWKFLSAATGTSFDVMVRASADGSNLWSYQFNGGDNHLFRIESISR